MADKEFAQKVCPAGYQIVPNHAISYLYDNHPMAYRAFYDRIGVDPEDAEKQKTKPNPVVYEDEDYKIIFNLQTSFSHVETRTRPLAIFEQESDARRYVECLKALEGLDPKRAKKALDAGRTHLKGEAWSYSVLLESLKELEGCRFAPPQVKETYEPPEMTQIESVDVITLVSKEYHSQ